MNISPQTVAALHREGWDIVRVSALLPANASDVEILGLARRLGRIVITQDLDFSTLLALGGYSDPSIVTLRLSNTDPAVVTRRLRQVLAGLESALQSGSAVTVEDNTVRIRNLPIR
ncbi:MAG: DUF5615 family PIN-like protein [Caldilineales bacterium]|nr:DUF5615 family PIN-like protein [Caldilineales bacterium]MCW5857845.1 DUF5615 family PIN-like protein [Caldilineales bacterium]